MKKYLKFLHKSSLGLSLLILLSIFVFALGKVYASTFTFSQVKIQKIQVDNNANVINNVNTESNTGGNTTTVDGGNATVQTGNAGSNTIICNDVNHTVINGNSGASCPSGSTVITPTPLPTATPTPGSGGCTTNCGGSSGGSGNSGSSNSSSGSGGGSTQAVLGASSMAGTGTFNDSVMNIITVLGFGLVALGFLKNKTLQIELAISA